MPFSIEVSDHRRSEQDRRAILDDPGFAVYPTDHLVTARWSDGAWGDFRVQPYGDLRLDPLAMALHYGQAIFEGMKVFQLDDGTLSIFRPEMNAHRFAQSANRLAMPAIAPDLFVESLEQLVRLDRDWIPRKRGMSLYLRPVMFATEACVTVRPSMTYQFVVIALPAAPYFNSDFGAISVCVVDELVRAAKGGTGEAKCAANYSAGMLAKKQAGALGCSEVLWLDARNHEKIEELGGMNVFFVERDENASFRLITPPLGGTILRGVTRDSLLQVASALGIATEERDITISEVRERAGTGEIAEAFACGTAAVVAPLEKVVFPDSSRVVFGDGKPGEITSRLYRELVNIQEGRSEMFPQWRHQIAI